MPIDYFELVRDLEAEHLSIRYYTSLETTLGNGREFTAQTNIQRLALEYFYTSVGTTWFAEKDVTFNLNLKLLEAYTG